MAAPSYIATSSAGGVPFLHIFTNFCNLCSFWWQPFWQIWGDISLWFWFAFPWWLTMLSIFSCACWLSVCLLWETVYSGLLPIFKSSCLFLMLSCMSCFYILNINPLCVISFANIFSHSLGCVFVLLMVSFAVQKLWSFIRSHLLIFAFILFPLL